MLRFNYDELENAVEETIQLASKKNDGQIELFGEVNEYNVTNYKISYVKKKPDINYSTDVYFHIVTIKAFKNQFKRLLKEMEVDESMSDTIMRDLIFEYNFQNLLQQLQSEGCIIE